MSTPVTVAETQEKIHRSKTKQADPQSGYLEEKIVGSEYVNITEEDGSVGKCLVVSLDASAIQAVSDHKVKVDASDTANYLENKIIATSGVAVAPDGTNPKTMKITGAYKAGTGISITGLATKTIASTITQVVTEDPFTGHTTKVPTSKAVADLLKNLYITDAADCGSSGDALLHKVKDIPLGSCSFVEKTSSPSFTDHYPTLGEILAANTTWSTLGNYGRGKGNSLLIFSTEAEGAGEYTAAICNLSLDEDIDMVADSTLYVDVLFECDATGDRNLIANVKCQPVFYDGTTLISALPYLPAAVIKQVEYPITDACIRKITYEIGLGDHCPDGKWLSGALVFTCDASADSKGATIIGLRARYATKTIGLRTADIDI